MVCRPRPRAVEDRALDDQDSRPRQRTAEARRVLRQAEGEGERSPSLLIAGEREVRHRGRQRAVRTEEGWPIPGAAGAATW